jgi:fructoselysine-6-P-deglycase FrlB-like protein
MSKLWQDTEGIPAAIRSTLAARDGFDDVVAVLGRARRAVVSGNGAAWYVALAAWLATLEGRASPPPLIAVPAGVLARGRFNWRGGDVLLAVSASGELRDLVEVLAAPASERPRATALITATPSSTLARHADAVATTRLEGAAAFTHSQAYAANLVAALDLVARWSGDAELGEAVTTAAVAAEQAIAVAAAWTPNVDMPRMATVFGSGCAWAAALQGALLLREVARLPAEGTETREAATSSMFAMAGGDLVVSLPVRGDQFADETERMCATRGARVLRAPGCDTGDPRLAPLLAFPASARLAIALAERQGLDPDAPAAAATYYATARQRAADVSADR